MRSNKNDAVHLGQGEGAANEVTRGEDGTTTYTPGGTS